MPPPASGPAGAERGNGVTLTGPFPPSRDRDEPADEPGADRTVTAEWALWGKKPDEPGYRVLRCSKGTFTPDDFHGIIARYASGAKETLPQYTVCWIPDENGHKGYLAVGIHELADPDPRRSGGRVRAARGREIEYLRLFCVRYSELADHRAGYTELVEAVRDELLPAHRLTDPIPVELRETESPRFVAPIRALAENVATLLLTNRPVCVLGAERTTAEDRLRFIDRVMSLLPYGLRSTLSASTWASPTAKGLKLRLFFSSTRRDGGQTCYVTWGQPVRLDLSGPEHLPLRHYLSWLERTGSGAVALLAGQQAPVRFDAAEIRQMVIGLPEDRPVKDILEELADALGRKERPAVTAAIERLRPHLDDPRDPADREAYRVMIKRLGLLGDHPALHYKTRESLYGVLLGLAFETPISYRTYRQIEDCAEGPPRGTRLGTLRREMLKLEFSDFVAWLVTARSEREFTDEALMAVMHERGFSTHAPVREFQQNVETLRPPHRAVAHDFAVRYLCDYGEDARTELARRGYLAQELQIVFPRDPRAQRARLEAALRFAYGERLSDDDISELYDQPGLRPTAAFDAAVARLGPAKRHGGGAIRASWERRLSGQVVISKAKVAAVLLFIVAIALLVVLVFLLFRSVRG